jgi:hypothetical protein
VRAGRSWSGPHGQAPSTLPLFHPVWGDAGPLPRGWASRAGLHRPGSHETITLPGMLGLAGKGQAMSTDQVLFGVGLILVLAVGSQVLASRLRIPALIILLPAGFTAGALTTDVNPQHLLGAAFQPLVSLAVAVILYDSGLALEWGKVAGRARRVIPRLVIWGCRSRWRSPRCWPPRCWACRPGRR